MIPFEKGYYEEKIREYKKKFKCKELGEFKILEGNILEGTIDSYLYKYNDKTNLPIMELSKGKKTYMSLSPKEIAGCYEAIRLAKGKVGVVGLGLGYYVQEILKNKRVNEVIVYEISEDVIEIYKNNFGENEKVKIIKGDAFKAEKNNFDFFFVDIYEYKLSKKIVSDYKIFINLHNIEEYYFFGLEKFLLDCPVEEVAMVYIPEEWMSGTRDLFERLNDSGLLSSYIECENKAEVLELLHEFKKIL